MCAAFFFIKTIFFLTLFFVRDRDSVSRGGAERERERECTPSRLPAISTEPDAWLELTKP